MPFDGINRNRAEALITPYAHNSESPAAADVFQQAARVSYTYCKTACRYIGTVCYRRHSGLTQSWDDVISATSFQTIAKFRTLLPPHATAVRAECIWASSNYSSPDIPVVSFHKITVAEVGGGASDASGGTDFRRPHSAALGVHRTGHGFGAGPNNANPPPAMTVFDDPQFTDFVQVTLSNVTPDPDAPTWLDITVEAYATTRNTVAAVYRPDQVTCWWECID